VASLTAWALGRPGDANARIALAFALAQGSRNPYDLAMALHFQGLLHACEQDAAKAEAVATRLLALSDENGFAYVADLARGTLGWSRGRRGAGEEGSVLLRQAWTSLAASGARVGMTFGLTQLAEALALAGRAAEALACIEDALSVNPQERVFRPETLRLRGELRRAADSALAEADFREAIATAKAMGAVAWEQRASTSLEKAGGANGSLAGDDWAGRA
jgi:tetratricopeptide (TPR) repeat protein